MKLFLATWTVLVTLSPLWGAKDNATSASEPVRVEGIVTYDGRLPEPIHVAEAGTFRELIEVDPKTKGLKDAVVWLEGVTEPVGSHQEVADKPVVMDQQSFFFVPHVLAVKSCQAVEFRNSDAANHGVRASSLEPRNQFNRMTPLRGHFTHRFVTSKHPVAIGCPIHSAMAGWIYVFDHGFHAVTDNKGRFTLPPVRTGRYTLRVHHPDGGLRKTVQILVDADTPLRLRIDFHEGDWKVAK
jgi:plastocyanin